MYVLHVHVCINSYLPTVLYLIRTVPILTPEKGEKRKDFIILACPYVYKNLSVVLGISGMTLSLKDFLSICPYQGWQTESV